jgi:hypothetical protein
VTDCSAGRQARSNDAVRRVKFSGYEDGRPVDFRRVFPPRLSTLPWHSGGGDKSGMPNVVGPVGSKLHIWPTQRTNREQYGIDNTLTY